MPSMLIRPLPEWNETLIWAPSEEEFWRRIHEFWNETVETIQYFYGSEGASMEASLTTLFDLQDCLAKFSEAEAHAKEAVDLCPMMFDSWNCWEAASPGTVQKMACPNFPHLGFNPSRPAYKTCTELGEWWRHPDTNMTWSNYTQCINLQDLEFRNTVNIISLTGLGISLLLMAISLFIFFYFRSLDCGRIKMHKNLFLSLSFNNIFWILWYLCVLYRPEVWSKNPVWCRVLQVTKTYFMLTTYFWMLCEGAYLQLLLANTWGVKQWQLFSLIAGGWGLPLLVITPYTVFRATSRAENKDCWMDPGESRWFLAVPVIIVILSNVMIVINVIRVIKRKRNLQSEDSHVAGGPNNSASTMKAARAALMLVPILGIHFLLMPIRPEQGTTLEYFYEVFSAISASYQGFFVSIIFCFMNTDVLDILKKKFCRRSHCFKNCFGQSEGPPRAMVHTTVMSVTNSPTGTTRATGALNSGLTTRRNLSSLFLHPMKGSDGTRSPGGHVAASGNFLQPLLPTRGRAKSLTSASATDLNKMASLRPPSNYPSLRSGDRKKRRSCAGGIMTESIRLYPNGLGDDLDATTTSHIVTPASEDGYMAVTQL